MVVVLAFTGVEQAGEVAGVVVVVLALVESVLLLADGVGVQAVLFVVVVVAEELALLALVFATGFEQVRSECLTIQFDAGKVAAFVVVEGEAVVVRQTEVLQLAAGVVAIAQGAPALVFGGERFCGSYS